MKKLILLFLAALLQATIINAVVPYKTGDIVKDFSLRNVNDKMVSLSQFKDVKGFIVVFCCNTCPVVKKYQQRIIDLNSRFSKEGYPVIAINSNDKEVSPGDSFEDMQKFARDKGLQFEYLYDETQEVAKLWGATNTPHVYVLSRKGDKLVVEYTGAIDNNADDPEKADKKYVVDAVNALLKNAPVPIASTKAVGCSIKWRKS